MSIPTPGEIKRRYEALQGLPDSKIQIVIDDAVPMFDVARWGELYPQGFAAYVAHMLTIDKTLAKYGATGTTGTMTSKAVGDVSVSYSAPTAQHGDSHFNSTAFGHRYLQLRRMAGAGAVVV